ncbi:hypothetical protein BC937DRAFT_92826 [Endogone sp. FLAS-F59071]|nr:hypothetical protein BC937DRAFT_92826 [Endogone sp. FLAS-F59071]|eukprot:RUS23067.1 hypothetical protein BC937DRAFT_92826 [Endogone sp. FLAS-F59071]
MDEGNKIHPTTTYVVALLIHFLLLFLHRQRGPCNRPKNSSNDPPRVQAVDAALHSPPPSHRNRLRPHQGQILEYDTPYNLLFNDEDTVFRKMCEASGEMDDLVEAVTLRRLGGVLNPSPVYLTSVSVGQGQYQPPQGTNVYVPPSLPYVQNQVYTPPESTFNNYVPPSENYGPPPGNYTPPPNNLPPPPPDEAHTAPPPPYHKWESERGANLQ